MLSVQYSSQDESRLLSERRVKALLDFAGMSMWKKILWSDEVKIKHFGQNSNGISPWRRVEHGDGSIVPCGLSQPQEQGGTDECCYVRKNSSRVLANFLTQQ